jgi:RNA polymerase sigma-70 factor, ECF subfamily
MAGASNHPDGGGRTAVEQFDELTLAALRARAGDQQAAGEFVRRSQTDVWRLCAHLGSPADADDLTQETYARAFGSLHRFAGRSSARTWLLSIARRVCADAIRARRPVSPVAEVEPVGPSSDPADTVSLRILLDSIDAGFREAFVLTQMLGLSYPEAADVVGCPVGTIRSRVARAREALVAGLDARRRRRSS